MKSLFQYGFREGGHDIKMSIKFIDELNDDKFIYVCVYYEKEETYGLIKNFCLKKIPLNHAYKFKKGIIKENLPKFSKVYTETDENNENLIVYGKKNDV